MYSQKQIEIEKKLNSGSSKVVYYVILKYYTVLALDILTCENIFLECQYLVQ